MRKSIFNWSAGRYIGRFCLENRVKQASLPVPQAGCLRYSSSPVKRLHLLSNACLAGFFLLLLLLTACQTNVTPFQDTIKVGLIAPFQGDLASVGESTLNAATIALEEVNEGGGLKIGGRDYIVEIVVGDSEGRPEQAVAVAEKLIHEDNVVALIGPQPSGNAIPVSDVAEAAQIPMISPWSSNPRTTQDKRYVFRVVATDDFQAAMLARFTFFSLDLQQTAVIYDRDEAYNTGLAEVFAQAFTELGGKVVHYSSYPSGGYNNIHSQLVWARETQAQAIFLPNYQYEVPLQVASAQRKGLDVTFVGADAWASIPPEDRAQLEGSFIISNWAAGVVNEKGLAFIETYETRHEKEVDDVAALTYDAFGLLFAALKHANRVSSEAIRDSLYALNSFDGITGAIDYVDSGDPLRDMMIMEIRGGKFVFYELVRPPK